MITSTLCVGHGQVLDLAEPELDVPQVGLRDVPAGFRDHLGSHVDADHAARLADLARREKRVESRAAPEVEHPFARLQFGDRLRVPTAEAQIGPFGCTAAFLIGVAERVRGGLGAWAAASGAAATARRPFLGCNSAVRLSNCGLYLLTIYRRCHELLLKSRRCLYRRDIVGKDAGVAEGNSASIVNCCRLPT